MLPAAVGASNTAGVSSGRAVGNGLELLALTAAGVRPTMLVGLIAGLSIVTILTGCGPTNEAAPVLVPVTAGEAFATVRGLATRSVLAERSACSIFEVFANFPYGC